MVGQELPRISWEESFGSAEAARVSDEIMAALTGPLAQPCAGRSRLYFITPTPMPYCNAEAAFLAAFAGHGGSPNDVRVVALARGGRCYAFADERLFKAQLPCAFRMGPPELTLIAANCDLDLRASEEAIASFVLTMLSDTWAGPAHDVVGMHFDSGDLVEMF